ncbi:IclR family transcriptional regulator [soil metagenome]
MRSVDRTLALFKLFSEHRDVLTVSVAARRLNIPVSSCFNLLRALEASGYLYEVGAKAFYPTGRLLQITQTISEHDPARLKVSPQLELLRDETGETALFTKQVGQHFVILDVHASQHMIRYEAKVGDLRDIATSASGKAFLATLPEKERIEAVSRMKLIQQTPRTITDKAKFLADIQRGIDRGWFMANGEGVIDVLALARPLEIGGSIYTVACVGPVHRMEPDLTRFAVKLLARCERIQALLQRK